MRPIRLAFSFIRVPRLFVSLLLWPMVVGVGIAVLQAVTSSAYFGLVTETTAQYSDRVSSESAEQIWVRRSLFGRQGPLPAITLCRWLTTPEGEVPPSPDCAPQQYDVVIRTDDPASFDPAEYQNFFDGSTRTLHLCRECTSEIVIEMRDGEIISNVHGLASLGVYMMADAANSTRISRHYIDAKAAIEHLKDVGGTVLLHPDGGRPAVNMTQASKTMILIINTSLITIIALWLSLKGHRKVLDYFARNGALLPLVAACGKDQFYTALWLITLLRVGFFLLAALPATVLVYARAVPDETLAVFIRSWPEFILWLSGIITSLSCLAIIASIAELKHRHSWVSFLYRYVPLLLCCTGTAMWFYCLFNAEPEYRLLENVIASIPVVGISPILLSPLLSIDSSVIAAHSVIAGVIVLFMLRLNSRWFAAHLEEI